MEIGCCGAVHWVIAAAGNPPHRRIVETYGYNYETWCLNGIDGDCEQRKTVLYNGRLATEAEKCSYRGVVQGKDLELSAFLEDRVRH